LDTTLVIFSGLPGTGKSTLANRLARELRLPLLRIDDVAGKVPANADFRFWDEKILILLNIAATQVASGVSVIADSVFMGADRLHAQETAQKHGALFRPVYCFVSDETLWEERVNARARLLRNTAVATWEQIQHQRQWFSAWQPGTGLFVDAVNSIERNYLRVREFVTSQNVDLAPLQVTAPLVAGQYHNRNSV